MSTYSELHHAWDNQREQLAEAREGIERQHGEILELTATADGLRAALDGQSMLLREWRSAIASALDDLRVLPEVSVKELPSCIEAIADRLRGVL